MKRRNLIIIKKIISEIKIAEEMVQDITIDKFLNDEKTKRAVCMTVINI